MGMSDWRNSHVAVALPSGVHTQPAWLLLHLLPLISCNHICRVCLCLWVSYEPQGPVPSGSKPSPTALPTYPATSMIPAQSAAGQYQALMVSVPPWLLLLLLLLWILTISLQWIFMLLSIFSFMLAFLILCLLLCNECQVEWPSSDLQALGKWMIFLSRLTLNSVRNLWLSAGWQSPWWSYHCFSC